MSTEQHTPLAINDKAIEHLRIARKWSNFLSVTGIVFLVLMGLVIIGVIAAFGFGGGFIGSTILLQVLPLTLITIIYTFPIYYLYQFGKWSKVAIHSHDSEAITKAFQYLKQHYRFMGVLLIVAFILYIIGIMIALALLPSMHKIF